MALDQNIKFNQTLWLLTEKMAELKQVERNPSIITEEIEEEVAKITGKG